MKYSILGVLSVITLFPAVCFSQAWLKLVPLQSTRTEVENILGKPDQSFDTYGLYERKEGGFSVWYSKGGCHKNFEGLQYKIPPRKMTALVVYLREELPLESYISNIKDFKRKEFFLKDGSYLYTSPDESIRIRTHFGNDAKEFVYSIDIHPAKDRQHLLCTKTK